MPRMFLWLAALLATGWLPAAAAEPSRPNIVLILADDLGYSDLGCFGSEIATPNLDRLAKEGVALTQFYNQARCCPTRAALMTGRYPHQVGVGLMIDDYAAASRAAANAPQYLDHLSPDSPVLPELLREAGYRTLMAGKWHLGKRPEEWPVKRGFDRSFVQIDGAMNYFGGDSGEGPRTRMAIDATPFTPPRDGFFSTDAFTDHAIGFVQESATQKVSRPFFLYLPYNAPHWPLQALDSDIAKYKGVYDAGWQAVRRDRLARMIRLGVVPQGQEMAPMDRGNQRPWDQLTDEQRAQWARRMEVYAAQVEHMDRAIGRLLAELKRLNLESNTMVVFLSDNGGAAEDPNGGDRTAPIGSRDSYRGYARPWASVSNTPWRRHKISAYEGGISTPLIARWPAGIPAENTGKWVREPGHLIDLLPTFVEVAGANPARSATRRFEGESILGMLKGGPGRSSREFYWEHEGNRGVRKGPWKLVGSGDAKSPWELYNLEKDRIESRNLADELPEVVKELASDYERWAARCGVQDHSEILARRRASRAQ